MTIEEIKQQLTILGVADHLGIQVNKHGKALCPFHDDKNPSLQFSAEKNIATCFSSNCSAGTMDIISLTEKYLKLSTHEAINQLKAWAGATPQQNTTKKEPAPPYAKLFTVFKANLKKSEKAKGYLRSRHLDADKLEAGYNAASWPQMKHCVVFPLRDSENQVSSFYGRSIYNDSTSRHYYSKNRSGLYPGHPASTTRSLILTESVIDAATLLQNEQITKEHSVLALYGTNGLTAEHKEAISQLTRLEEIILFLDGDPAGEQAVKKIAGELLSFKRKITSIATPEGEDINSLAESHTGEVFAHLLSQRKPVQTGAATPGPGTLVSENPNRLSFTTHLASYFVAGGVRKEWDSLRVTLIIQHATARIKYRNKLDLYEHRQVERVAREASEKLTLRADLLQIDLEHLTDKLESYREQRYGQTEAAPPKTHLLSPAEAQAARAFLSGPGLLKRLNALIGQAGVVGEETSRLFLFVIATSYKMEATLHALIQGSSGSGKTHLLAKVSGLVPEEAVYHFTRVTEGSFYNYGAYDLKNKLICLEDLDGMEEKAQLAFRELQSREMLSTSTTGQDEKGNIRSYQKVVYGPMASLACTTKGEVYEDNMGRVFLIAVDETKEQTARVIAYQNAKASGQVDTGEQKQAAEFICNLVRLLKPCKVINPYAGRVSLPTEAHKIRRLNELYQGFVKQVTILHQYRRKKDRHGRLITEKEDLQIAAEIMFESIVLKVDELDGSLRLFYERLKDYVRSRDGEHYESYSFSQREIRQALHISKTGLHRYIRDLLSLEYLALVGGYANRGYRYKISYWDNIAKLRDKVKRHLQGQLDQLELDIESNKKLAFQTGGTPDGTPATAKNIESVK